MSANAEKERHQPVAVVTGGAGGLGHAIAQQLILDGFHVAIVDRDGAAVDDAAGRLCELRPAAAAAYQCDLTVESDVVDVVARIASDNGRLDVLVNNAGIELGGPIESLSLAAWQQTLSVNVTAAFLLARTAVPIWRAQGGGHVVNIASRTWLSGTSDTAYVASKAAVVGLTRALAVELGPLGVTANAVAPSFVRTPMNSVKGDPGSVEAYAQAFVAASPLRRLIDPVDVAHAVAFLASERARNITGEVIHVCAGTQLAAQIAAPEEHTL